MANESAATSANAFGGFLSALGVVLAIGSIVVGLLVGYSVHTSQVNNVMGQPAVPGSVQTLGYIGAVGIGVGGAVVGMMLLWAGLVLRTLAVLATPGRPGMGDRSLPVRQVAQPMPWAVPEVSLPRFGDVP